MPINKKSAVKGKGEFSKKLAGLRDNWSSAASEAKDMGTGGGDDLPAGVFICKLTDAKLMEVGDDNTLKMLTTFTCVSGDHKGETSTRWDNLEREDGLKWVALHLMALGIEDPDDIDPSNLEETLNELKEAAPFVRLRVKVNSEGYSNQRVLKLLDADSLPDDVSTETEEEIPSKKPAKASKKEAAEEPEEDPESAEIEKGSDVTFKSGKKTITGVVKKMLKGGKMALVETDDAEVEIDVDELALVEAEAEAEVEAEAETEAEDTPPEVGDKVSFEAKGKTVIGKVTAVNAKKETLKAVAKGVTYELDFSEATKLATEE